jgi:hypothetical protein
MNADVREAHPTALESWAVDAVDGTVALMVMPFNTMVMGPLSNAHEPLCTVRSNDDPE